MDSLITKILSSKIRLQYKNKKYKIKKFVDWELRQLADELKLQIIEENKYAGFMHLNEVLIRLIQAKQIPINFKDKIKDLQKQVDSLKSDLYNNRYDEKKIKSIKRNLTKIKTEQISLLMKVHSLDYLTLEGYASDIANRFIVGKNLDKKVPYVILSRIANLYLEAVPNYLQIRGVAKSDEWRAMWMSKREGLFTNEVDDLQIQLISLSRMYDSVYESADKPEDFVIKDDDMLDGWLITQSRKHEKDRKKAEIDSQVPANAQEVFWTPKSKEDAERIEALNDNRARLFKERRRQIVQKHGTISESELVKDYKLTHE